MGLWRARLLAVVAVIVVAFIAFLVPPDSLMSWPASRAITPEPLVEPDSVPPTMVLSPQPAIPAQDPTATATVPIVVASEPTPDPTEEPVQVGEAGTTEGSIAAVREWAGESAATDEQQPETDSTIPDRRAEESSPQDQQKVDVGLPRRIRIPEVGVDAGFEFVGLTPQGAMGTPQDPDNVAWYQEGPRPGAPGNALIAGHVDWAGKIRAFWWLRQLAPGSIIEILTEDGQKYEFVVEWARWYEAATAPAGEIFRQSSAAEITLITCGGTFDRSSREYLSRLVVRARLR